MTKAKNETPEQRERRLAYQRKYRRELREKKTPAELEIRREYHRKYARQLRTKDPEIGRRYRTSEKGKAREAANRKRYKEDPDYRHRRLESGAKYRNSSNGKTVRATRRRHPSVRARKRSNNLLTNYGLVVDEVDSMIVDQNGLCAICESLPTGKMAEAVLHVDHDHETGQVRGMLCGNCNRALGCLKDDILIAERLILYLKRYSDRQSLTGQNGRRPASHSD